MNRLAAHRHPYHSENGGIIGMVFAYLLKYLGRKTLIKVRVDHW
jgi:hypothetical protein